MKSPTGSSSALLRALPSMGLLLPLTTLLSLTSPSWARQQLCFDRLSDTAALYLQEHPARWRAAVGTQSGMIYLMSLPGLGGRAKMNTISTYLDLSGRVKNGDETGLLSFAFHPGFARNGRFFVSYICDPNHHDDCRANFGCVPPGGCGVSSGSATTIIAEYSAGKNPLKATQLNPREVRRILMYGRPHNNHMGGHIFFGKDGLLYITSGDGGSQGDPNDLAQNLQSYFGKMMRLNVNSFTKTTNYTIPRSNPFQGSNENPLIFSLGLRNPWRCDQNPWGLIACGDVGGSLVEEVNVVFSRGNYEWSNYEGNIYHKNERDTSKLAGVAQGPLFSYTHDSLGGLGCIIGGVFSSNPANKCLVGKYMYADHSGPVWLSWIAKNSWTQRVDFICNPKSPMSCPTSSGDGSNTEWGEVDSWSKDLWGNPYLLTSSGIFRVAKQSTCGIKC